TFGAGIGGVGVLSKEGDGDDTYRAETLCEGFGSFGIGLLRDSGGTDDYEAMLYAQGSARSQGAGWLIDGAGRDMYRCGGLVDAGAKFPTAHLSCAQAYADGWSGLGGGCGLLTDLGGDDVYVCEVRGQGCALDGGVASLYDKSGNDDYSGYDEGQAFASQSSFSTLFDLDGDDTYTMKVGSCHALGTGYGVALLLDRAGDDVYMARESAPGSGVEHGLGLFVDAEGTDRYYGPPGKGVVAGGSGSLGVFVDLNGDDVYTAGLADGQSKSTPTWGVALDQASTVPTREVGRPQPVPGSDQMPDDDTMAAVFSAATQPDASAAVQDALDRLVRIGAPGLEWMLKNRLDGADSYGVQAFATVVGALGPEGSRQIGAKTFSATDAELAALIEIAVSASVKDFGAVLPGLMKKPALRAAAIAAAGDLNARAAVPELLAACRDKDAEVVRSAVASLTKIADPQSATTAQAMLLNEDFMVRKEAVALMAQFPSQALTAGTSLAGSTDEGRARTGIDVLGRVGTAEALDKIAQMLLDPRPGVRMEALMQLDGRCPEKYRLDFLSLLQDPVALVRSVAKSVSAGGQS
ncbi:MAG TPA: HEAT repeat domain-containing protein, partial [Fimbriimonadaceae bacterium]|nr:HEAT repeat domain-containing protein [Fimbriimonadaceae bacterium]